MKRFITLLMLFAFTISFAAPKDNLNTQKNTTHEKVFTVADIPGIDIDIQFVQVAKVDRSNIHYQYNSKGFSVFNIQESRFFSSVTESGFSENYDTNKQNYAETYNSKITTFYSKTIQERSEYNSRMFLRGIQTNHRFTKGNYNTTKGDYYFKRKFGNFTSVKNSRLGNAINMDWRDLVSINNFIDNIYSIEITKA